MLADRHVWDIVGEYVDPDAPANRLDKREDWLDCLEDAAAGRIDIIAAWDTSRLWRSTEMKILTMKELHATGVTHVATLSGMWPTDPEADPEGNFTSTVLAAASELENTLRTLKSRRGKRRRAEQGLALGGNRSWGFADTQRTAAKPDEVATIREVASRLLQLESCRAIADDLNHRGITTPQGHPWRGNTLRYAILRPALAKLAVHKGRVIGPGRWVADPILDRETRDELVKLLRPGQKPRSGRLRRLLSGLLFCGRDGCGLKLYSGVRHGKRVYRCTPVPGAHEGCGRLSILAEPTEAEIKDRVLAELADDAKFVRHLEAAAGDNRRASEASKTLAELEERRTLIGRQLARGADPTAKLAFLDELDRAEAEAQRVLDAAEAPRVALLRAVSKDPSGWWEAHERRGDVELCRALLATLVEWVMVMPAERGASQFNADRLQLRWR